ncbi:membrane protein [Micromonospora coerulea]|uniref:Membrane protein n=1 Tax=Micromonospora coerulea TaxID=47856 RepID=A0ABP8SZ58_9ACTN
MAEPVGVRPDEAGGPTPAPRRATNKGPGRLLIAVYILFAIAATSRAGLQIATKFDEAPVAYLLSAVAALIYIVAAVGLGRAGHAGRRVALACCSVELVGVVAVGILSLADKELFPDETVWSGFGSGYGYIPLVLPVLGLLWLWRTRHAAA